MTLNHSKTWPVCTFALVELRVDLHDRIYSTLNDRIAKETAECLALFIPDNLGRATENVPEKGGCKADLQIVSPENKSAHEDPAEKTENGVILPLALSRRHLELFANMSTHLPKATIRTDTLSTTLEQDEFDSDHQLSIERFGNPCTQAKEDITADRNDLAPPATDCLSSDKAGGDATAGAKLTGRRPSNNVDNWELIYKENKANTFSKVYNDAATSELLNGRGNKVDAECKGGGCSKHNECLLPDLPLDARKVTTLRRHYYPEGGWGWVIIVCSVLIHVLNHGLQLSCSQLVSPAAEKFKTIPLNVADPNFAQMLLQHAEACYIEHPLTEAKENNPGENREEHVDKLWSNENTLLLISLVKKYEKEFEKSVKKYIWQKIAKELSEKTNKMTYTFTQTDTKWKGLVRTYKDVVKHNNTTGTAKKYWDYFDLVHEIVFKKPEITAPATCSSHNGLITNTPPNLHESNSMQVATSSSNNRSHWESSFSRKRRERDSQITKRHEDKMQRLDKLQASIDRMVDVMEGKKQA